MKTALLVLALLLCGPAAGPSARPADLRHGNFGAGTSAAGQPKPPAKKRNTYPYSGELESHDSKSITLKGKRKPRVLLLTPETRVLRNGARAALARAAPGERVSGSTRKNADGREEALTINLKGAAPAK